VKNTSTIVSKPCLMARKLDETTTAGTPPQTEGQFHLRRGLGNKDEADISYKWQVWGVQS
jgi:hypothetical protein